ncbi:F-box protein CPR1-like [Vicia villosa]|uniref:F-box protein CPR1-like n=1 Tax=Vicia villosa TaxID=3911 RepID=UPI00273CBA2F|nr:F-box protein CPR1-like [Vicia villosa]
MNQKSEFHGYPKIMLWNPATTEFKIIFEEYDGFSKDWSDHYQVGYDYVKDDYKMIRRTHRRPRTSECGISTFWEIFSLNNNSWRKIDGHFPHSSHSYRCSEEVYVDGVSHWCEKIGTHTHLVSFDFSIESFITTPVPSYTDDVFDIISKMWMRKRILTVLNGSIGFIVHSEETSTFHILILGELGVEESWTKLFIVGPLPCLKIPIGIGKKGNILISKKDKELAWFDISTGTIDEIGVTAETHVNVSSTFLIDDQKVKRVCIALVPSLNFLNSTTNPHCQPHGSYRSRRNLRSLAGQGRFQKKHDAAAAGFRVQEIVLATMTSYIYPSNGKCQ